MKQTLITLSAILLLISCQKSINEPAALSSNVSNTETTTQPVLIQTEGESITQGVIGTKAQLAFAYVWLPEDYTGYHISRIVWTLHKVSGSIKWRFIQNSVDTFNSRHRILDQIPRDQKEIFQHVGQGWDLTPGAGNDIDGLHQIGLNYMVVGATAGATLTATLDSVYIQKSGVDVPVNIPDHKNETIRF